MPATKQEAPAPPLETPAAAEPMPEPLDIDKGNTGETGDDLERIPAAPDTSFEPDQPPKGSVPNSMPSSVPNSVPPVSVKPAVFVKPATYLHWAVALLALVAVGEAIAIGDAPTESGGRATARDVDGGQPRYSGSGSHRSHQRPVGGRDAAAIEDWSRHEIDQRRKPACRRFRNRMASWAARGSSRGRSRLDAARR